METIRQVTEAIVRSKRYLPAALAGQLDAFMTPENLEILAGTIAIWAGSHFFGVGEIADVALLLVGAFTIGWSITQVAGHLIDFGTGVVRARSDQDIDRAAASFASAVVAAGVTVVFAILLRRSAAKLQARAPCLSQVIRPREPGLLEVEPEPDGNGLLREPTITADPSLPAGQGATSAYGDVVYSTAGTATERQLARLHELVHSFFSPRLALLRTFRARLAVSAYTRSAILRYLEESLAESFAQVRVNGLGHLLTGIRFPISNGYLTLQQLACEGAELGKIVFGTERFSVQFIVGVPPLGGRR